MVIQLIDNNILVPKIVSSKVKINALFSILIVLAGGALWGYSGMFLAIPLCYPQNYFRPHRRAETMGAFAGNKNTRCAFRGKMAGTMGHDFQTKKRMQGELLHPNKSEAASH
jgi:hypothetical protein